MKAGVHMGEIYQPFLGPRMLVPLLSFRKSEPLDSLFGLTSLNCMTVSYNQELPLNSKVKLGGNRPMKPSTLKSKQMELNEYNST